MKQSVKIFCAALAGAMVLSLAGCRLSTPANVLTVEGKDISAGVYLMLQMQAYSTAEGMLEPDEKVLKATIEEKKGADWVHEETLRLVRRYAYLENEFEAQGLTFSEEELASLSTQSKTNWASAQPTMERNGVGQASYNKVYENEMKYEQLYTAFAEKFEKDVDDKKAMAYMDDMYTHVTTFSLPTTTEDGKEIPKEDSEKIATMAQEVADKLTADNFDTIAEDYLKQAMELCGRTYAEDSLSQYKSTTFVTEDYMYFPEDFVAQIMETKSGTAGVYVLNENPIVYQVIPNYADAAEFTESYKDTIVSGMSIEAFDEAIDADAAAYEIIEDANAVRTYAVSKVNMA